MIELKVAISRKNKEVIAVLSPDETMCADTRQSVLVLQARYDDLEVMPIQQGMDTIEALHCTSPEEVTQQHFDDQLEAVPPRRQVADMFLAGELVYGTVGTFCVSHGGRYFQLCQRSSKSFADIRAMVQAHILGQGVSA